MSRPRNSESVFRAIADPQRRRIIELLNTSERTVGDLIDVMRLNRTALSYHLGVLIAAGLVRQRRHGTFMMCVVNTAALHDVLAWITRNIRTRKPPVAAR